MRERILSFSINTAIGLKIYNLNRQTGYYSNADNTENYTKIDFICKLNSAIDSVEIFDNHPTRPFVLKVGEHCNKGRIQGFFYRNSKLYVRSTNFYNPFLVTEVRPFVEEPIRPITAVANTIMTNIGTNVITKTNNVFETLEAKILNSYNRPIRLSKFFKKNLPKTLEEFLINFYKEYNKNHQTIFVDDKTVQTDVNKRRSLGDIFIICKYYYPTCTLKEVINTLYNVLPVKITNGYRQSFCSTIKKRVFYYQPETYTENYMQQGRDDEYGNSVDFYTENLKK